MASFAIEVPGESNPLTENLLIHSLKYASSTDSFQIQTGTKQLQQWEKSVDYYVHLQSAFLDRRLPLEVRYLAVIQLKNGIDKYWRKTSANAVTKENKEVIRGRLLRLEERDNRLALGNALVYAKIVRYEFPKDFPSAISQLVDAIRSTDLRPSLQLLRAQQILLQIVKELSTARLQRSRQSLQSATPELVRVLGQSYLSNLDVGLRDRGEEPLTLSLLALKTIRRLLISGFEYPNREPEVIDFWRLTIQNFGNLLRMRHYGSPLIDKHIVQLGKLHYSLATDHPAAFVLLPDSLELVRAYWSMVKDFSPRLSSAGSDQLSVDAAQSSIDGSTADETPTIEKLALRGLFILRACVKLVHNPAHTFKYRRPEDSEEKAVATRMVDRDLLTDDFVKGILDVTMMRFFLLRDSDMREWNQEAEEWENRADTDSEQWEFSIRSCSEKLFLDLAINYKSVVLQPLLAVFRSVASPEYQDVLLKDSVYNAIGLSAPVLNEHLDFDAFIREVMVAEVQKQTTGSNILRRRATILLGQWISVKVSNDSKPLVYQIFQHVLNEKDSINDLVVRITAGRQLGRIADEWEFRAEPFLPFAETIISSLMGLIEEVSLMETKLALLNTISVIVERLQHHISPFTQRIVALLPPLWDQSGKEYLMKQAILALLTRLVHAMKASSQPLHQPMMPIIKSAVEPGSDAHVHLLEDALELWDAILQQTQGDVSTEITGLIPNIPPIFEMDTESLRKALEITESYILLVPDVMLTESVRNTFILSFAGMVGSLRPEATGAVCTVMEMMIRMAEKLGGESAVRQMASDMLRTGLLGKLLTGLHGAWRAHCTSGPLVDQRAPVDGIVETDYLAVFARLILGCTEGFCSLIASAAEFPDASGSGTGLEATMTWLLEEWFSHFENVGDPTRQKLMCLALTKLLETQQPWILLSLQSLLTIWTDTIIEFREEASDTTGDSLVYDNSFLEAPDRENMPEAPEEARRRVFTFSDHVHRINLQEFVKHFLQGAIETSGGFEEFEAQWLINVDKDVVAAFSKLGVL